MNDPILEDEYVEFEGASVRTRTAYYPNGRREIWIETPAIDSLLGRVRRFDGTLGTTGDGVPLPDAIEISVLYPSGLWGGIDVTDVVMGLSVSELHLIRDGDSATLPLALRCDDDFEIVGSLCRYFGVLPDFDWRGMKVPTDLSDELLRSAQTLRLEQTSHSSMLINPLGVGR